MNRTQFVLLTVALVAVVAIVGSAAAVTATNPGPAPDRNDEYIGHWYTIECKKYTSDGVYVHTDYTDAPIYDTDIYKVEDGVFYGWYSGNNVCGTLVDGKMSYAAYDPSGISVVASGVFRDGCLYASSLYMMPEWVPSERVGVMSILLCKDYNCTKTLQDMENICGTWNLFDGVTYDGNATPLPEGAEFTVTGQEGTIFKGYIQLQGYDGLETCPVRGSFFIFKNGASIGTMMDTRGNVCSVYLRDGVFTLETVREMGADSDGDGSSIGAVRRSYSKDPNAEYKPLVDPAGFLGTTWRCVKVETMDQFGNVTREGSRSFLEVTKQYENYLYCMERASDQSIPIIVVCHDSGNVRVINAVSGELYKYSDMYVVDDDNFVMYISYDRGYDVIVQARYFEKYSEDTNLDLTGHWYAAQRAGYDENGDYVFQNLAEEDLAEYDLDIYVNNDGLFRGWYMGEYIAGYCDGTTMAFMDSSSDERYYVAGTVENSNSISLNEAYYDSSTGAISGYTTYFTKDRGAILSNDINLDLTGIWTMSDGTVCYVDGTTELEKPQHLQVDSMDDGVFIGTMDVKGPSSISSVDIRGSMLPGLSSTEVSGFIMDGAGDLWFGKFSESSMYITRVVTSVNPLHEGEMSVVEKVFTPDGGMSAVDVPLTDLRGTWEAKEVSMMCADGTYTTENARYILNVDSQTRNMVLGTCTYGTMLGGTFSITMQYAELAVLLNYGVNFSGSADIGMGTLIDDGHMVLFESFRDSTDKIWMQKTVFERQYYT